MTNLSLLDEINSPFSAVVVKEEMAMLISTEMLGILTQGACFWRQSQVQIRKTAILCWFHTNFIFQPRGYHVDAICNFSTSCH